MSEGDSRAPLENPESVLLNTLVYKNHGPFLCLSYSISHTLLRSSLSFWPLRKIQSVGSYELLPLAHPLARRGDLCGQ